MAERVPFSLLLPVYGRDRPDFLRRAFTSTVTDQTRRPDDVVIVQDGPVAIGERLQQARRALDITHEERDRTGGQGRRGRGRCRGWIRHRR